MNKGISVKILTSNDLSYDQRMLRIAQSLRKEGYDVEWIGRRTKDSIPLRPRDFKQTRLNCFIQNGPLFYLFLNVRLLLYLLFSRKDVIYAVDLDTILAALWSGKLSGAEVVYDAHEYFTEVPELENRPLVRQIWRLIARYSIPRCDLSITVGQSLADQLEREYGVPFHVLRNYPKSDQEQAVRDDIPVRSPTVLLYQGALNKGRGLEQAFKVLSRMESVELWLAGEGDLSVELRGLASELDLEDRIRFLGMIPPEDLPSWTVQADIGLNLLEEKSENYYYSLANKFLDYIHAGLPSISMDFPEYRAINERYGVALLTEDLQTDRLVRSVQSLIDDRELYERLYRGCLTARRELTWDHEEPKLIRWISRLE